MCEKSRTATLSALWLLLVMATRLEASAQTIAPEARAHSPSAEATPGFFIGGLHYGVPLKWSTLIAVSSPVGSEESRAFIGAEPGIGGWRASVGYLGMTSTLGGGYSARAPLLR